MAVASPSPSNSATLLTFRRPALYPKQLAAIFDPARWSVIEASTKSGKSHGAIAWLFEQAILGSAGQNFVWVAPIYAQARIAYVRLRRSLRHLPREHWTANGTQQTITLANGAVLWFKGSDNADSLYGDDSHAVVIDEASRCSADAWHAIRSTLTHTEGHVRVIGNVRGRKNWAYQLARRAEAGEPNMAFHRITARDAVEAGVISADEVEAARRDLPENVFRELYEAVPSDDEGNPFGIDAIRDCIAPALSNAPPVVWGWDLGKHRDYTVGIALDADGAVCRLQRFRQPWTETLATVQRETGRTPAYVDSTGVGDSIVEGLQRGGTGMFFGFVFTAPSKQKLMESLAVAIQQRAIRYPQGVISDELEQFEYQVRPTSGVRYSAPEGAHDDAVCSLALAVYEHAKYAMAPDMIYGLATCHSCQRKYIQPPEGAKPCPHCNAIPDAA